MEFMIASFLNNYGKKSGSLISEPNKFFIVLEASYFWNSGF